MNREREKLTMQTQAEIQKILLECEKDLIELSLVNEDAVGDEDFRTRIFRFVAVKLAHGLKATELRREDEPHA